MKKIETERTNLRRLEPSDFENMRILEMDPLVMKFTPSRIMQSAEQTKNRLQRQIEKQSSLEPFGIWVAESKADSSFVGWFMLMPLENSLLELGFMIAQTYWKKGLATEVCKALIDFAQKHGLIDKIIAQTNVNNVGSMRVLEKLNFELRKTIMVPEQNLGNYELHVFELATEEECKSNPKDG